jgi:uncharacterized protein (TIGR03663 family)
LRPKAIFIASILLAAGLRFPNLAHRPMHADEGVHADKFGTLLEGGGYAYDPTEYHGPTLYYLTLPSAWLRGQMRYADLDEVTLRAVPAVLGVALVAAHFGARPLLGPAAAALAAVLLALSPAMVYYSRYYIHETLLVFFSFGALLAAGRYLERPRVGWAILAGTSAGAMQATKETAPIALGSALVALAAVAILEHRRGAPASPANPTLSRDLLLAVSAALATALLLFTSFLTHPAGLTDAVETYASWLERARTASWHTHPWDYYLRLLIHSRSDGAPLWTEASILLLALLGAVAGWRRTGAPGADPRALRFLSLYALLMIGVYSAIPYKTPWCLLGFLHGLILLAGAGAAWLLQAPRTRALRSLAALILVAALGHLGWLAWAASFRFAADPRNPWVYAHTGTDAPKLAERLEELARADPEGLSMPVQIVSRENLWPLPWYLRGLPGVRWWDGVSDEAPLAPVVVITPEMEAALVRRLYDVPLPGERELYLRLFERPVELRPGVELRGYVSKRLWDAWLRLEADSLAPGSRSSE